MMSRGALALVCAALALGAPAAGAHSTSSSFLSINVPSADAAPQLRWDIAIVDLQWTIDFDADQNGEITWDEIRGRRDSIARLSLGSLELKRGGVLCGLSLTDLALVVRQEDPHAALSVAASCPAAGPLSVRSSLFFAEDDSQRVLLSVQRGVAPDLQRNDTVLSPSSPSWTEPRRPSAWREFGRFIAQGALHVWIGYDHLAFLALLLLPAVLAPAARGWTAAPGGRAVLVDVLKIVTAFTVAHSITLGLAATGTVQLPSRPIEIAIAGSIVVAGLMNLNPAWARARLAIAALFGLVHGFGFANALAGIGAEGVRLVPMLGGFNLGVEVAQLSVVALLLPVLFWARGSGLYAARVMPALSVLIGMTGAVWFVQRMGA